jgi:hypothetical protein
MLSKNLNSIGFELLDDKENKTVERIKTESLTWYIIKRTTKNKSIKLFGRRFGAGLQYVKQAVFKRRSDNCPLFYCSKKMQTITITMT